MSRDWDERMGVGSARMARFAAVTALGCVLSALTLAPAMAQLPGAAPQNSKERMVVDARELVYDNDKNTVSAVGDVQIFYQGRTIEADRVVYDRNAKRVVATGNARITEANGTIITGDKFNLTDDFKDGFIDSMRVENSDKTRFTSPRGERTNGETFVFDKGIYTACEPCKDNPEKPPLWQVRATRIIHNSAEKMIYYEDARLEFWGVPMAYIPFMSGPDATVKRKTGLLAPSFLSTNALGFGVAQPFFWNLAPNYDLTLTPTILSRQGFLGQAEWRHRLESGTYSIRVAGIDQADPSAFQASPFGPRDKSFRGSVETVGKFFINDKWTLGWDVAMSTDRWFFQNYRIRTESMTTSFLRESTSTVFLNGKTDTAWFDLRGYYFRPTSYTDWQKQQPIVHPVLDYNKRFAGPGFLGGEVTLDANVVSLSREAAAFQEIPRQTSTLIAFGGTSPTSLFEGCAVYKRGSCLVRGLGGEFSRATIEASWKRTIIDPVGQVWTPFASVRADTFWIDPDVTRYANANVMGLIDTGRDNFARVMPAVGLTYRFPLVANNAWGTHIIEPIAQIIVRPNETHITRTPNEDAQSLVFDDANLFSASKFSGYDRVEGGVRTNIGAQYTARFSTDAHFNLLVGQSFNLAGKNSYAKGDQLNTGLDSGLDKNRSDYVARAQFAPNASWMFSARGRFDPVDLKPNRIELSAARSIGALTGRVTYARYERQPSIGLDRRREGLLSAVNYKVTNFWNVGGSVLFDMDRHIQDRERYQLQIEDFNRNPGLVSQPIRPKTNLLVPAAVTLSVGYKDECTTLDLSYSRSFADRLAGAKQDSQTFLFKLELRTLGQATVKQSLGAATADGIAQ